MRKKRLFFRVAEKEWEHLYLMSEFSAIGARRLCFIIHTWMLGCLDAWMLGCLDFGQPWTTMPETLPSRVVRGVRQGF
jgi:hypothetical protein